MSARSDAERTIARTLAAHQLTEGTGLPIDTVPDEMVDAIWKRHFPAAKIILQRLREMGFAVVPVQPTDEMKKDGMDASPSWLCAFDPSTGEAAALPAHMYERRRQSLSDEEAGDIYKTMVESFCRSEE